MTSLTDSPIARARLSAWIVWVVLVASVIILLYHFYKSPPNPSIRLDLTIFSLTLLLHTLVAVGLHISRALFLRVLLVFTTISALVLEAILHEPLDKGIIWWAITLSFILPSLIVKPEEFRYGYFITGGITLLAILLIATRSYFPQYPQNPFNTDPLRLVLVTIGIGLGGSVIVQRFAELTAQKLSERERKLTEMMAQQEKVIAELQQKQAEAEAALRQIEELRQVEQKRAETEQFLNRYEVLMRTGYQQTPEAFCQRLLDTLSEEVSVIEAVLYRQAPPEEWEVVATWGALSKKGKILRSPFLETIASLRKVRWVSVDGKHASLPITSFPVLSPRGILYLPFFHEAQSQTVAIAELILGEEVSSELVEKVSLLLPRIGTYLAIRTQQTALI